MIVIDHSNTSSPDYMIDVPVAHSGVNTEWGWDGMSILGYADGNEYFKKSFRNGNFRKSVWFRFWDGTHATLSRLPQIVANGGIGTHLDSNMEFYRLYADGNYLGFDVDALDMAGMPHYPYPQTGIPARVDMRNWGEGWMNYYLEDTYSLDTSGDIFGADKTSNFWGAWNILSPSISSSGQSYVGLYPWALLVFKDWSDSQIDLCLKQNSSATLPTWCTSQVSDARFGFKFYAQPIDNAGSQSSWRIDNIDMPSFTSGELSHWWYKGRIADYKIVGKETKSGHTYTVVKICAPINPSTGKTAYSYYNTTFKKLSMPFFNVMLYGPVLTTGGPYYTSPILTGIHVLEIGCEYEIIEAT